MEHRRSYIGGMGGGKIRGNTGHAEGDQVQGGGSEERKWAGADVGMLRIEIVGEELMVEGVPLKRGRKKRK